MTTYYVDTNVFIRFYLKDSLVLWNKANTYLKKAKQNNIKLVLLPEVVFEIEYVLRKIYRLPREKVFVYLSYLLKQSFIEIKNIDLLNQCVLIYFSHKIDLVDIYLYLTAKNNGAKILSFDKDFLKLEKI